jgi:hypothetical protein
MHPEINTQHTKIKTRIFLSIFTSISPTITLIVHHYIGLQKNCPAIKHPDNRITSPCKAQDLLSECDTLLLIDHECVKPDRIADLCRIADILHEYAGDPIIAL